MSFLTVQSISSYTRNMEMQLKWQKKKSTNDFHADGNTKLDPVRRQAEEIRQSQNDRSAKLKSQIDLKLQSGQRLTSEEMQYLEAHEPEKYRYVKSMQAEQDSYERELKRCKTKDEVQKVKMEHTAASLSAVNTIMHDPAIPEEKKFELVMREHYKNQAFQESTREFVESGKYAKLPTEEEREKAEKELKEAKEKELHIEDTAKKIEEAAENGEGKENSGGVKNDGAAGSSGTTEGPRPGTAKPAPDEAEDVGKIERLKAELTPEAQKVKRARARAAYQQSELDLGSSQILDIKVK